MTQNNLLDIIRGLLTERLAEPRFITRFEALAEFRLRRIPLLIVIGGAPCTGKGYLAMSLSQRLNIPNVLQTDLLFEALQAMKMGHGAADSRFFWQTERPSDGAARGGSAVAVFKEQARRVWKVCVPDMTKCLKDGKPLMMNGHHLDAPGYLKALKAAVQAAWGVDSLRSPTLPPFVACFFLVTADKCMQKVFLQNWQYNRRSDAQYRSSHEILRLFNRIQKIHERRLDEAQAKFHNLFRVTYKDESLPVDMLNEMHESVLQAVEALLLPPHE